VTEDAKSGVEVKTSGTKVTVDPDAGKVTTSTGTVEPGKTSTTGGTSSDSSGGGGITDSGSTYPKPSTKFELVTDGELPTDGTVKAQIQQTAANAYKIVLSGTIEAQVWGDIVKEGAFTEAYDIANTAKNDKTGMFSYVTLSGVLPAGITTTFVTENPAYAALYDPDALAEATEEANPNAYHDENGKYHRTINLTGKPADTLVYVLWSGGNEITTVVTNGAEAQYTLTVDYSGLRFKFAADENITVTSELEVPEGALALITENKTLTIETGATLVIPKGSTLAVADDAVIDLTGTIDIQGELVLYNGGKLISNDGASLTFAEGGVFSDEDTEDAFELTGVVDDSALVLSGSTLTLTGGIEISGAYNVPQGITLAVDGELFITGILGVDGTLAVGEEGIVTGDGFLYLGATGTLDVGSEDKANELFADFATPGTAITDTASNPEFVFYTNSEGGSIAFAVGTKCIRGSGLTDAMNASFPVDSGFEWTEDGSTGEYTLSYTPPPIPLFLQTSA
jgi:hypothetical protein